MCYDTWLALYILSIMLYNTTRVWCYYECLSSLRRTHDLRSRINFRANDLMTLASGTQASTRKSASQPFRGQQNKDDQRLLGLKCVCVWPSNKSTAKYHLTLLPASASQTNITFTVVTCTIQVLIRDTMTNVPLNSSSTDARTHGVGHRSLLARTPVAWSAEFVQNVQNEEIKGKKKKKLKKPILQVLVQSFTVL